VKKNIAGISSNIMLQHVTNNFTSTICEVFNNRIISKGLWPPSSPVLATVTFISGELKGKVYKNDPHAAEAQQNV
jgi:hypothetical protein